MSAPKEIYTPLLLALLNCICIWRTSFLRVSLLFLSSERWSSDRISCNRSVNILILALSKGAVMLCSLLILLFWADKPISATNMEQNNRRKLIDIFFMMNCLNASALYQSQKDCYNCYNQ